MATGPFRRALLTALAIALAVSLAPWPAPSPASAQNCNIFTQSNCPSSGGGGGGSGGSGGGSVSPPVVPPVIPASAFRTPLFKDAVTRLATRVAQYINYLNALRGREVAASVARYQPEIQRLEMSALLYAYFGIFLPGASYGSDTLTDAVRNLNAESLEASKLINDRYEALILPEKAKLSFLRKLAADPPDPNYRALEQPSFPPVQAIVAGPGFSPATAEAYTAKGINDAQVIGLARALLRSVERAQGAANAGDALWVQQQQAAAGRYAAQLAAALENEAVLRVRLRDALVLDGFLAPPPTPAEVLFTQARGIAPIEIPTLALMGLDPLSVVALQADLLASNPFEAATLGPFPLSLTDPLLFTALQETAGAMGAFATIAGQPARLLPPPVTNFLPPLLLAVPPPPLPPPPALGALPGVALPTLTLAPASLPDGSAVPQPAAAPQNSQIQGAMPAQGGGSGP
jgi:hypothetical protein